jgi:hypothetical protein
MHYPTAVATGTERNCLKPPAKATPSHFCHVFWQFYYIRNHPVPLQFLNGLTACEKIAGNDDALNCV